MCAYIARVHVCPQLTGVHSLFKVSGHQPLVGVVNKKSFLVVRSFARFISPSCIFTSLLHLPDRAVVASEECVGTRELRINLDCSFQEGNGGSMPTLHPDTPAFTKCPPSLK